jgi:shikimate kinase
MFNVCTVCGVSHVEPDFDGSNYLVCSSCGDRRPFRRLPLLLVGGPAGAGKSTVGALLLGELTEAVVIESDLLWRREFDTPEDGYNEYFRLWLRLAAHISQSGRPVALFGAGFAVPHNAESLAERQLFSAVHYLGLVCDDDMLVARLRARPSWRNTTDELIHEHVKFNHWLKEHAAATAPPVTLIDTTSAALTETAALVARWIRERVGGATQPTPSTPYLTPPRRSRR